MTNDENIAVNNLVNKFPDFGNSWKKLLESEYSDEGDEDFISFYTVATEFSEYVIKLYNENEEQKLNEVFYEIELMVESNSEEVSDVALVGFVEGILVLRSQKGIAIDAFDKWLGKSSKKFWYQMHDFFTGN